MKFPSAELITSEELMLWIMYRFAEVFRDHALLKGGMELMLLSSERATNDLDYVFVPYQSKTEIIPTIDQILADIPNIEIKKSLHSSSGRYRIVVGGATIQVEFNVAQSMPSTDLSTELLARKVGYLPRVIRVMSFDVAFAHKLAAWNERRLVQDLYDAYYWYANVNILPDLAVLKKRLSKIQSRLPKLKMVKKMTLAEFFSELKRQVQGMTEREFLQALSPLMGGEKLGGLFPVFRTKLQELISQVERTST